MRHVLAQRDAPGVVHQVADVLKHKLFEFKQHPFLVIPVRSLRASGEAHEHVLSDPELTAAESAMWVNALCSLNGMAMFDNEQHDVHVRVAGTDDRIYLDFAKNPAGQRRSLETVLWNCTFDSGTLSATDSKPFDLLVRGNETGEWRGRRDSCQAPRERRDA